MQIIIKIKPCKSRDKIGYLKGEIDDMQGGAYNDIIESVELVGP